jgi:HORMA domain
MHADEYQPPCFKAADANMVAHFTKKPFTMDVGAVNTNHHNVGLKVRSTLRAFTSALHAVACRDSHLHATCTL